MQAELNQLPSILTIALLSFVIILSMLVYLLTSLNATFCSLSKQISYPIPKYLKIKYNINLSEVPELKGLS